MKVGNTDLIRRDCDDELCKFLPLFVKVGNTDLIRRDCDQNYHHQLTQYTYQVGNTDLIRRDCDVSSVISIVSGIATSLEIQTWLEGIATRLYLSDSAFFISLEIQTWLEGIATLYNIFLNSFRLLMLEIQTWLEGIATYYYFIIYTI